MISWLKAGYSGTVRLDLDVEVLVYAWYRCGCDFTVEDRTPENSRNLSPNPI